MTPAAVAFFCMHQRGHLQRMRPLVASLAARGVAAHVFTDRRLADDVRACGGIFEDLFAGHEIRDVDAASMPAPFRYVTFAGRYADDVAERVARLRPATVIYDSFAMIGRAVATRLGVPFVNVCAGHNVHPGRLRDLLPTIPPTHPSEHCLQAAATLSEEMAIAYGDPFTYLCAPSPHLNIYCEPPEFLTATERAAFEPVAFFGSLDLSRGASSDTAARTAAFRDAPPDALRVFVSFGTVNWRYWPAEAERALRLIADELDRLPGVQVLISLGGHGQALGALPSTLARDNVRVADYVDQWAVLQEADAFITHHGLNSSHEAIYHGVPMLSLPFLWDQPALALKCQQFGLAAPLGDGVRGMAAGVVRSAVEELAGRREVFAARLHAAREWETRVMAGRDEVTTRILSLG